MQVGRPEPQAILALHVHVTPAPAGIVRHDPPKPSVELRPVHKTVDAHLPRNERLCTSALGASTGAARSCVVAVAVADDVDDRGGRRRHARLATAECGEHRGLSRGAHLR